MSELNFHVMMLLDRLEDFERQTDLREAAIYTDKITPILARLRTMLNWPGAPDNIEDDAEAMAILAAGEFGTFWLHDADWKMLDGKAYSSKDAAMKGRSQIIDRARRSVQ